MDHKKLSLIADWTLEQKLSNKPYSDKFAGVFVHSNSPITSKNYLAPIHSFRVFSKYQYPIYFFVSDDCITEDFKKLNYKYGPFKIVNINKLKSIYEFNNFCINQLLYLINPSHNNLIYIQSDGWILNHGYEELVENYQFIGARWKEPVQVIENKFNFMPINFGNGGCGYRRRDICIKIKEMVDSFGGQNDIVKGVRIVTETGVIQQSGSFLAEDLFFNYFGQNFGLIQDPGKEFLDKIAVEPITSERFKSDNKPCFFHRIDR